MTETARPELRPVTSVAGHPVPLRGNDIDTDRIIPARFMTAITFDGMGELAFYDVRFDADGKEVDHPMNDPKHRAKGCLLYTSPSPRDLSTSRMPSSA